MNIVICPECGEHLVEEEKNLYVCPVCGYSICVEVRDE